MKHKNTLVGRMQNFRILKQLVHTESTGFKKFLIGSAGIEGSALFDDDRYRKLVTDVALV